MPIPGFEAASNETRAVHNEAAVLKSLRYGVKHGELHCHGLVHSGFPHELQRGVEVKRQ